MTRRDSLLQKATQAKRESRTVDFKEEFDPSRPRDYCEVIKDLVAMANSGGGVIVFGVRNDGSTAQTDLAALRRLDPAVLTDKIFSYTGVQFADFEIHEVKRGHKSVVALVVLSATLPLVFEKPGTYSVDPKAQRTAFGAGTIYFRHGAKSEPARNADLRASLERELQRTRRIWTSRLRKVVEAPPNHVVQVFPTSVKGRGDSSAFVGRIVADGHAPAVRPENADEFWPHRQKDVIRIVKERRPGARFNGFDITCLRSVFRLDEERREFIYQPFRQSSPQYSDVFVDWIVEQLTLDSLFLEKTRQAYKQLRIGR